MEAGLIRTGLRIVDEGAVVLPADLARLMSNIYHSLPQKDRGDEYGLYMRGEWDPARCEVAVRPGEYYIPRQSVSPAFMRFDEDPPDPSWNVVIHRHPPGVTSFSGEDRNSINEEFLASLLFIPEWSFPAAVINVPVAPGVKLRIPARVRVEGELFEGARELRELLRARVGHGVGGPPPSTAPTARPARGDAPGTRVAFEDGGGFEVLDEEPHGAPPPRPFAAPRGPGRGAPGVYRPEPVDFDPSAPGLSGPEIERIFEEHLSAQGGRPLRALPRGGRPY